MKESVYYQHIVGKAKAEGLVEGREEGLAEGESLGISEALIALIRNRFTSVPRTALKTIKSTHDKNSLFSIQNLAIDAKTREEFVNAFNALNL